MMSGEESDQNVANNLGDILSQTFGGYSSFTWESLKTLLYITLMLHFISCDSKHRCNRLMMIGCRW